MRNTALILTLTAVLLVACSSDEPAVHDSPDTAPQPTAASNPSAGAPSPQGQSGAAPFSPISSRDRLAGGAQIVAPGATFTLPDSWLSEPPSSRMRLAQAKIPGAGGDAQMTAFYFGPGGGGGVESNLQRWIGQVEVDPAIEPSRDTFAVGDFSVTWVDVAGTLKPSTMGTGPSTPQPDSRLLAAVVEGPQGPWFFKATGPNSTLEAEREAFLAMLRSVVPNV